MPHRKMGGAGLPYNVSTNIDSLAGWKLGEWDLNAGIEMLNLLHEPERCQWKNA